MITRKILKEQIDFVNDKHLALLHEILKAFETKPAKTDCSDTSDWRDFLETFSGCMAEAPIERAPQGQYENREEIA